jgi:hypothetical protein
LDTNEAQIEADLALDFGPPGPKTKGQLCN